MRKNSKLANVKVTNYMFLILGVFVSVFPFVWILVGSTNKSVDVTLGKFTFGSELLQNWEILNKDGAAVQAFWNTAFVTITTTVLSILVCSLAGYGFEKYRSKVTDVIYALFLFSMMIPFAAQMIPLFRMMNMFGLGDNLLAVVLPNIAMPFLIFFFRQNFKSFPTELIEAARLDGAGEFSIFFRVVIPAMKSTFAAGAIYAFMKQWNNYLWPLIILQSNEKRTLTLFISSLSSAYFVDYGVLMLSIVFSTIPVVLIFITMQKHYVEGIVGSSK